MSTHKDLSSYDAAYYDVGWDTQWDDMKKYGPMSRHIRRYIKKLIRPLDFKSVLDVGCGQGSLLQELMAEFPGIEPHGVDLSQSAADIAQRRVPGGTFGTLDLTQATTGRTYDLLICSEVLEHIEDDMAAMRNLRRMCNPGGHLVVTTVQGRMRKFEPEGVGHVRNYKYGELVGKLRDAGFDIVKDVSWGWPLFSPLYRNVLEATSAKGTTGEFGGGRKFIATAMYYAFFLNLPVWGDEIFVLARAGHGAAK
ncbi:MAG TPA: class I SAM-dependent methyltransferase [Longimicrobiales bacterium]